MNLLNTTLTICRDAEFYRDEPRKLEEVVGQHVRRAVTEALREAAGCCDDELGPLREDLRSLDLERSDCYTAGLVVGVESMAGRLRARADEVEHGT